MSTPTWRQMEYVTALKARLHLSDTWFDGYCQATYGSTVPHMDVPTCSELLEEMLGWTESPASLLRAQGQVDMFGGAL